MLLTALLVKLTSPGPIFFVQKRLGLNKRMFHIYKFRTMVVDAEARLKDLEHLNEANGAVFKIKKDPRITLVGAFLRKTSIDELPQLFNVLKGEMSLVGPRPLQVRDYELFETHCRRLAAQALQRASGNYLSLADQGTKFHHLRKVDGTGSAIHPHLVVVARPGNSRQDCSRCPQRIWGRVTKVFTV